MTPGQKISRLRADLSPESLAKHVGTSGPTIRRIEAEARTFRSDVALRVARYFNVTADWLLDDEAGWPPPETDEQTATGLVQQALAGAGLAGELADDERTLLTGWRRLPDGPRQRILGMMQGFLDAGEAYQSTDPKDLRLLRQVEALLKRDTGRAQQPPKPEERTA